MNESNETIVKASFLKKIQDAGLGEGYKEVPKDLMPRAKMLLGNKEIVTYSNDKKLKKQIMRLKNRLRDAKLAAARESEIVKLQQR